MSNGSSFTLIKISHQDDRLPYCISNAQSAEMGRRPLSTRIALNISQRTGVDLAWLTNNNPAAPLIDHAGEVYSRAAFEWRRQTKARAPDASHYRWRELQLGAAFDLLYRLLAASRPKGKDTVDGFMQRLENFIKTELEKHVKLEDAIYGERRRAQEAASKTGRIMALGLLTPFDLKPLKRGRARLGQAMAAFTSRPLQPRRVKSDKRV
jgi:hypothetical protein